MDVKPINDLWTVLLYAALAGATIPIGGLLARVDRVLPQWLEDELRHTIIAFGGGVLLAAVALVLVPKGIQMMSSSAALVSFAGGGLAFFLFDRLVEGRGGSFAQFSAMLLDFIPESLALGAMLSVEPRSGLLLALLIAEQNLPEGFNAYRELQSTHGLAGRVILSGFCALVLLGPIMAWIGYRYLRDAPEVLAATMLFSAGGILYLTFQDIAPQAQLKRHWAPGLGAVGGFMLGMGGQMLVE